jgi:hypothetical protein
MIIFQKQGWICMAKLKTAHISPVIKQKSVGGYGLKSPYAFNPSDTNTRGQSVAGAGDYYGTGVRNPMGRIRDASGTNPVSKKGLTKPPKSLA